MSDDPDCCIAELRHSLLQVLSSFPLKAFSSLYWPLEGTKYLRETPALSKARKHHILKGLHLLLKQMACVYRANTSSFWFSSIKAEAIGF